MYGYDVNRVVAVFAADTSEKTITDGIQEIIEVVSVEEIQMRAETPDQVLVGDSRLRGSDKPTTSWNLSTQGQYDFDYSVYGNSYCYSGVNITGVTDSVLYVNSSTDDGSVDTYGIEIWKNNLLLDTKIGAHEWSTDTDHEKVIVISNMEQDAKYYFIIVPTGTYLSGWGHWRERGENE